MRYGSTVKPRPKINIKFLFLLSVIAAGVIYYIRRPETIISPIPNNKAVTSKSAAVLFQKKKTPSELRNMIIQTIGTSWKNYSVYIKDLSSPFEVGINETVMYPAASVNKIPILSGLYYQVQQNTVDLDNQITVQPKDVQDYGSGVIRNEGPGQTYSVKTLARLMMQQSDNTAAYIIATYVVPIGTIQRLISSWGLIQTDMDKNTTSNKDMAILLTKIFSGGLVNTAFTQEMLSFLKDSVYEDRLPKNLPHTATVYHKTGDGIGEIHDVGIVTDGTMRYYIGIFTSDITNEDQTKNLMAELSRKTYDYLKP